MGGVRLGRAWARTLPQARQLVLRQEAAQHEQLVAQIGRHLIVLLQDGTLQVLAQRHGHDGRVLAAKLGDVVADHRGGREILIIDRRLKRVLQPHHLAPHCGKLRRGRKLAELGLEAALGTQHRVGQPPRGLADAHARAHSDARGAPEQRADDEERAD
eukprot:6277452-Prymnesium_polylepis.1